MDLARCTQDNILYNALEKSGKRKKGSGDANAILL